MLAPGDCNYIRILLGKQSKNELTVNRIKNLFSQREVSLVFLSILMIILLVSEKYTVAKSEIP